VESISPASGSEFSILPAQNSSGNYVKVVQRIPVRISHRPQTGRSRPACGHERVCQHRYRASPFAGRSVL